MRKIFFIFLFCFSSMQSQETIEKKPEVASVAQREITIYNFCFIAKEFLYFGCFLFWVIDRQKLGECVVSCNNCNNSRDSFYTYGFFASTADAKVMKTLKKLMRKGDKQCLTAFMVKLYNAKSMRCFHCGTFSGWHDPEQMLTSN